MTDAKVTVEEMINHIVNEIGHNPSFCPDCYAIRAALTEHAALRKKVEGLSKRADEFLEEGAQGDPDLIGFLEFIRDLAAGKERP